MFYSQFLLSKKGPLGTIWVAAHCHKRLKKDQLKQTDISASVDKILQEGVPVVTYRILAYLLLGVVKIFSKKVDFLFDDCCNARDNLEILAGVKRANESSETMQPYTHSISLPKRFELDAFELDVLVDQDISCCNIRPREEIMLADTSKEGLECTNEKYYCHGDLSFEAYSSTYTPVRDVFSPYFMDIDFDVTSSRVKRNLGSDLEKLQGIRFSIEEQLESMMFGEAEKVSGADMSNEGNESDKEQIRIPGIVEPAELIKLLDKEQMRNRESGGKQVRNHESGSGADMPSNEGLESNREQITNADTGEPTELLELLDKELSMEKLLETMPPLEETLKPMLCSELGEESSLHLPSNLECQTNGEQIKHPESGISYEERETLVKPFDKELNVESEEMRVLEMTPMRNQIIVKQPISITMDASLDSKFQGAVSPDFMAVRTPSTKERARVTKKRKCLFDETIVLSNNVVKHWVDGSSDLVCKRRKAPCTVFHAWTSHKISNLPQSFLEPLIPCNSVAFKSLVSQKNLKTKEPVETAEVHLNEIIGQTPVDQVVDEIRVKDRSREQTPIAPATPITRSTSLRLHEVRGVCRPETSEPASSFESMERELAPNEDLDTSLIDEEINSSVGDIHEKNQCSVRARKVAKYLHEKFQGQRKRNGEISVNLTRVLKGKTRKESARVFYEILVLKTGEYIDVMQERAFGDILVKEFPKLRDALGTEA